MRVITPHKCIVVEILKKVREKCVKGYINTNRITSVPQENIYDNQPSLSYSLKASLSSACIASASSSTMNLEASVMNSSNSSSPEPKIQFVFAHNIIFYNHERTILIYLRYYILKHFFCCLNSKHP